MLEAFKPTRTWDSSQHRHRNFQSVICSKCGYVDNIPVHTRTHLPPDVIVKKMQRRGWVMGHKRKDDICPRCKKNGGSHHDIFQRTPRRLQET